MRIVVIGGTGLIGPRYFGTRLSGSELVPGHDAELSTTTFADWLAAQSAPMM